MLSAKYLKTNGGNNGSAICIQRRFSARSTWGVLERVSNDPVNCPIPIQVAKECSCRNVAESDAIGELVHQITWFSLT